jgi:hypothetical protein
LSTSSYMCWGKSGTILRYACCSPESLANFMSQYLWAKPILCGESKHSEHFNAPFLWQLHHFLQSPHPSFMTDGWWPPLPLCPSWIAIHNYCHMPGHPRRVQLCR